MKNWLAVGFAVSALTVGGALAEGVTTSPPSNTSPPQTSPQPAATGPVIAQDGDPELDKVICKKVDVPGTRIGGKKVCKTKREWNQIQRDTADALRQTQDAGLRNNPTSGAP